MSTDNNLPSAAYVSDTSQRLLRTLDVLFGHEIDGLLPGEIGKLVGCSPANTTRDLANLLEAGMCERIDGRGSYRVSARLASRALASLNAIDEAARQMADLRQRYTTNI